MQTDNRLFDDLARVATSAIGSLQSARGEAASRIRQQFERIVESMDLVSREEFDAVKAMARKARLENDKLAKRVAALEDKLGVAPKPSRRASAGAGAGAAKPATAKAKRKGTAGKAAAGAKPATPGRRTGTSGRRRTAPS